MTQTTDTSKKRVGRPRKTEVEAQKTKGKVGRPKGDAAIISEYKARMLASPKSKKVMDVIFDAALNDDHKNQAAAWKLIADRIIPVSVFEQDIKRSGGKSAITINISGIGEGVNISGETEPEGDQGTYIDYEEIQDGMRD